MMSLRGLTSTAVIMIALVGCNAPVNPGRPQPKQIFHEDLGLLGFRTKPSGQIVGIFTNVNFLTDNLILVTINDRVYGPVEKTNTDQPLSKLLLFDVSQNRLLNAASMPVEKDRGAVRALEGGRFALLNEEGLHICTLEFACGLPFATGGPLFVSPEGTKIVVGGNGQKEQKLLDGMTLEELDRFPFENPSVIPGDRALIVARPQREVYARVPGQPDQQLPFERLNLWPEERFINRDSVAGFESATVLAIVKVDGTVLFRVPVESRWGISEVVASASGTRFCFHEGGYTPWNSFVNFLDVDSGRPINVESVKIMSSDNGNSLFQLVWDPRPYVGMPITPALSPNGQRLAIVRHGILEIFAIP
jgi:hypothetical protein